MGMETPQDSGEYTWLAAYLWMRRISRMIRVLRRLRQLRHIDIVGGALCVARVDVGAGDAVGLLEWKGLISSFFAFLFLKVGRGKR